MVCSFASAARAERRRVPCWSGMRAENRTHFSSSRSKARRVQTYSRGAL
ncbi:hypothetical protein AB395_00003863 [Sinorhizobium fredii CCBAU 45436]|nr:hypothetical protein AB395_00003863 [Sinorhizobium fredii CCBAU 45436]AWM27169.1 hypothetical protein AOX55_00003945 [Sinorhizobium fredii CCBAU 25509]